MSEPTVPDDDELRRLLSSLDAPNTLDARAIIGRARRRRLPRQLAAGTFGALALAGITVIAVQSIPQYSSTSMLADQGELAPVTGGGAGADSGRAPVLCGGPAPEAVPTQQGLRLEVVFPATAPSGTAAIEGSVRLSNTGTQSLTGFTSASPTLTVSQQDVTLAGSAGLALATATTVDLAPGASIEYPASFVAVSCEPVGSGAQPATLPPGIYELTATLDLAPDAGGSQSSPATGPLQGTELVTSPRTTIVLQ